MLCFEKEIGDFLHLYNFKGMFQFIYIYITFMETNNTKGSQTRMLTRQNIIHSPPQKEEKKKPR